MEKFKEHEVAKAMLKGLKGIEIGGAVHNPFGLDTINVAAPVENINYPDWHLEPENSVRAWAHELPFEDSSYDFVISSHVVEHLPDPISTFIEWDRVVKGDGIIFMIVPLRDALKEDVDRPITTLSHLLEDFEAKHTIETHSIEGVPEGKMGHYHVHTLESILDLVYYMNSKGLLRWDLILWERKDSKVGNGFTVAFRKVP